MLFFHSHRTYNVLIWGDDFVADALYKWLSNSSRVGEIYNSKDVYAVVQFPVRFYTERKLDEFSINEIISFAKQRKVNLFICDWSDNTQGIIEAFQKNGIKTVGTNKKFAKIETSKEIGKKFMNISGISTAPYIVALNKDDIFRGLEKFGFPLVVKANGPAKGLGVFICNDNNDIDNAFLKLTDGVLFPKQEKFIVEKCIQGDEFVVVSLWDGKTLLPMLPLKDYKLRFENNKGNNTGSMGQYFPYKISDKVSILLDEYLNKLESGLRKMKVNYKGAIYSALIVKDDELYCIEYNMRIGLTEGPLFTLHLKNEPLEIFEALINQKLDKLNLLWKEGSAACVNIVNKQYPEILKEPIEVDVNVIKELENKGISAFSNVNIRKNESKYQSGGTLFFCLAKSSINPIEEIYESLKSIDFENTFLNCDYRKDIGQ